MGLTHLLRAGFYTHVGGVLTAVGGTTFKLFPAVKVDEGLASVAEGPAVSFERACAIAAGSKIVYRLFCRHDAPLISPRRMYQVS